MTRIDASADLQARAPGPNDWQGAEIVGIEAASDNIRKILVRTDIAVAYRPGQHIDVRLTADDGYQASRSYSVAEALPTGTDLELLVERLPDGEVSGYFHDHAEVGARIEVKGPIGGHFVWDAPGSGAVLCVAGGSGIAPILAMIRHRNRSRSDVPVGLIYAARHASNLVALDELKQAAQADPLFALGIYLSREVAASPDWSNGRVDNDALFSFMRAIPAAPAIVYICGSNGFVETMSTALIVIGVPTHIIRTERFGDAVT